MSKARLEIPGLGTLIGIDELSQLTGISKHTIRSWRKPENLHLAKFRYVKNPHNQNLFYRLDEVEAWMKEQGIDGETIKSSWTFQEGTPNAIALPLQAEVDPRARELILELKKFDTNNAWTIFRHLVPGDTGGAKNYAECREAHIIANEEWCKLHPDATPTFKLYSPKPHDDHYGAGYLPVRSWMEKDPSHIAELERWYFVLVNGLRLRRSLKSPGILTPTEVCAIPIGSVPPTNESLK